jgi:hypothetical protein
MEQPFNFNEHPLRLNYTNSGPIQPAGGSPATDRSHESLRSGGSQNAMLEIKNSRKRTEADLQLLANRIALLRMEEERAKQKVTDTKQRADDIKRLKTRNNALIEERMKTKLAKELHEKELRDKVKRDKKTRQTKVEITRKIIAESRREEAIRLKQSITQQITETASGREQVEVVNRQKAANERKRKDDIKKAREQAKEEKERANQVRYAHKLEEERRKADGAQKLIEQMEREEAALIENLKNTQKMQEKAYAMLQESLES